MNYKFYTKESKEKLENEIALFRLTGNKEIAGDRVTGNSAVFCFSNGHMTRIGKHLTDNALAIGYTEGRSAGIGEYMYDNSMTIGYSTGDQSYIGGRMHKNSIVIGYTEGSGSSIGVDLQGNSIVMGYAKGQGASIGKSMSDNSIAIGYVEGEYATIGGFMSGKSRAIGFEKDKFVLKDAYGKIKYVENELTEQLKNKLKILKNLETAKFKTTDDFNINLKEWTETINKFEKPNEKFDQIAESITKLNKSRTLLIENNKLWGNDSLFADILKIVNKIIKK